MNLKQDSFHKVYLSKIFDRIAQKMNFSVRDFFSKCDQIGRNLRIWSHSLKKSIMENFIFRVVRGVLTMLSNIYDDAFCKIFLGRNYTPPGSIALTSKVILVV